MTDAGERPQLSSLHRWNLQARRCDAGCGQGNRMVPYCVIAVQTPASQLLQSKSQEATHASQPTDTIALRVWTPPARSPFQRGASGSVRCKGFISSGLAKKEPVFRRVKCPGQDLNLHDVTRCHLKAVRLPIPPPGLLDFRRDYTRANETVESAVGHMRTRLGWKIQDSPQRRGGHREKQKATRNGIESAGRNEIQSILGLRMFIRDNSWPTIFLCDLYASAVNKSGC